MRTIARAVLAGLLALLPVTEASAARLLRFERGVVVDATGFDRPMAAASLFVPYGWRMDGGVVWGAEHACTNGYNFEWAAVAPDGSAGVRILPQMRWENTDYGAGASTPGCGGAPFGSAREYLAARAEATYPGARMLAYRDRPDVAAEVSAGPTTSPMPMGEIRTWTEGGEVLVAFEAGGRPMRATVAGAVSFTLTVTDLSGFMANDPATLFGIPQIGPTRLQALNAFAHPSWSAFAPDGQLDFVFFEHLRRSIEPNPAWTRAIVGHNVAIGRVALEESRKRARAVMESQAEIARIRQETFAARWESDTRRLREFGEALRGVETYADPHAPGGTAELSASYRGAWRLNDGTYLLSDDVNFDPWRDLQIEGTRLEPVP